MIHRKTIMFLALLGTYAAQASESYPEGYLPEYAAQSGYVRPSATQASRENIVFGYAEGGANYPVVPYEGKPQVSERRLVEKQSAKSESASMKKQLEKAKRDGGDELLCSVAARFGRSLKYLPKAKGPVTRKMLADKCGDFFEENGHPRALEAVKS